MPGGSRSLPGRPSLRYLKLEAKRRLAVGEFPTLHDAQVAIAREHGLPTWAALKQRVCEIPDSEIPDSEIPDSETPGRSHALDQLRWIIARFKEADQQAWIPPSNDELSQHFDEHFLAVLPPPALIKTIGKMAADLRGDPVILGQTPVQAYIQLEGIHYMAVTEPGPPHRLIGLRGLPVGSRVHDPRVADPPVRTQGEVPDQVATIAEQAFAELGLTALLLAGGDRNTTQPWILTQGWADLDRSDRGDGGDRGDRGDRAEPLDPAHRFPAPGVTALVTVTAVLRLTADNLIGLDRPANEYLTSISLADGTITVRELLSHTAGVDSPTEVNADQVPELPDFLGPVVHASGPRGTVYPSNGGIAVLGQLVADVTGMPYAAAATRLVLEPLHLNDSSFPARAVDISPERHPRAVTSYRLTMEGRFETIPARVCTLQAVGGLWSTGADLVRLGLGWSSLLPEALAHEALTPQSVPDSGGARVGLGWIIPPRGEVATHAGANVDATAAVTTRIRDQRTHVVLTTRLIPVTSIETRLLHAWTNP
ncbi:MAG: serine hydrolase domain-containing protein [Streptosporangiaceae bacterium]